MADTTFGVKINSDDLAKTAQKYRKEFLQMPVIALQRSLQFMSIRPGIRYAETVGEMSGDIQFGPYSETREDNSEVVINPRTLYTFFGSVVRNFSPNKIYQSMWGSDITKGDGLKGTDITRMVIAYLSAQLGKNLNKNLFTAIRKDDGDKTKDLFNGFDTIASTELTAKTLSEAIGNLKTIVKITSANAVDVLQSICESAADELMDEEELFLFCPKHVYTDYCKDYKATTGAAPYNTEYKKTFIEGYDNVTIVPLANKSNSPFLQLTPKRNMLVGVNQMGDEEDIEVARFKAFVLQFIATMFFGVQYESISPERILFATIDGVTAI
jgi:hypothetical protein